MPEVLQNPAYQHVVLNHLPIVGTAMGLLALAVGWVLRNRTAMLPGLVILALCGASAWPVYFTGDAAYKPIRKIADDAGADWLDTHMERAEGKAAVFYFMAGAAALAIASAGRWPRVSLGLTGVAALAAVACVALAVWIAEAGGKIRHSEFRAPPSESQPADSD